MSAYGPHGGALGPKPTAPKPGDKIVIRWPGGPYDFEIVFHYEDDSMPPASDGWLWLRGLVVKPEGLQHRCVRTFHVTRVGDEFALLPHTDPVERA